MTINSFYEQLRNDKTNHKRSFFAEQTIEQLMKPNPVITWTWGLDRLAKIDCPEYKGESKGLMFTVKGLKFVGVVLITLDYTDTYNVKFYKHSNDGTECVYTEQPDLELSNVYCDQLTLTIDKTVET